MKIYYSQTSPFPPLIRVNRRAYPFGRYKTVVAPVWLARAHRPSLTVTHLRPLDQSPHLLRVHFWPLASAAEMGSHGGVAPGRAQHAKGKSTINIAMELSLSHLPRLVFSFHNLSLLLSAV